MCYIRKHQIKKECQQQRNGAKVEHSSLVCILLDFFLSFTLVYDEWNYTKTINRRNRICETLSVLPLVFVCRFNIFPFVTLKRRWWCRCPNAFTVSMLLLSVSFTTPFHYSHRYEGSPRLKIRKRITEAWRTDAWNSKLIELNAKSTTSRVWRATWTIRFGTSNDDSFSIDI